MRAAGDRERRGRAARGGRHRRQRGPARAAARSARRWPPRSADVLAEPGARRGDGARRARARRARCSAGSDAAARARRRVRGDAACCSPSISSGLGSAAASACSTRAAARGATASARSSAARAWSASTSTAPSLHAGGRRAALPRPRSSAGSARCSRATPSTCPSRDATFDKVICSEVMEHVHDYRGAARELARVLRPGGLRRGHDPDRDQRAPLPARSATTTSSRPGGHIRIFRPRELAQGLARAGLATDGRRLRARAAHALLGAALGRRVCRAPTRAALVRAYRLFLIRATVSPAIGAARARAQLLLPEERDPVRARSARRARRGASGMSARPLRIAFVAYRGNMRCGGQGIYLWFLARELARLGHRVDVLGRPALPRPDAVRARVSELPERAVLGQVVLARPARAAPAPAPAARVRAARASTSSARAASASCPSRSRSACARCARSPRGCARASATTSCTTCSASAAACSACARSACRW